MTKNHVIATPVIYQDLAHVAVIRGGKMVREAVKYNSVAMIVVQDAVR